MVSREIGQLVAMRQRTWGRPLARVSSARRIVQALKAAALPLPLPPDHRCEAAAVVAWLASSRSPSINRRNSYGFYRAVLSHLFIHQKGPPPWRGARYLFSVVCVRSTRALERVRSTLFQLSTFTDTVVRLSLFAALISRMPSR